MSAIFAQINGLRPYSWRPATYFVIIRSGGSSWWGASGSSQLGNIGMDARRLEIESASALNPISIKRCPPDHVDFVPRTLGPRDLLRLRYETMGRDLRLIRRTQLDVSLNTQEESKLT
jgi:hypothetical protein